MSELIQNLPVVALRGMTVLPDMVIHFDVSRERSVHAIEQAMFRQKTPALKICTGLEPLLP